MSRSPSGCDGAGQRLLDFRGIEVAPARRDMLVGADQIGRSWLSVIAAGQRAFRIDQVAADDVHPRPDVAERYLALGRRAAEGQHHEADADRVEEPAAPPSLEIGASSQLVPGASFPCTGR